MDAIVNCDAGVCVVSLEISHGVLVLLHVEVGIATEVVIGVLIAHFIRL